MYEYRVVEVVSIYDGDTLDVIIDLGFGITYRQTLRLYGINAPEMKGAEKEKGTVSRDWLRQKLGEAKAKNEAVFIKTIKDTTEKYGRLLASIFVGNEVKSLNEQLVEQGLAVKYMIKNVKCLILLVC